MNLKNNLLFPITWISPKLKVDHTENCGNGVFAKANIKKNEKVAIFGGHIIPINNFYKLPKKLQSFPFHIDDDFLIGCIREDEISEGEFFNHNCSPNAGFGGQTFLLAMKNIKKGEEVTFDYAMCMTSKIVDMDCQCGSKICRKKITSNDWKIPELQKKYKNYFQPYIIKKIKNKK